MIEIPKSNAREKQRMNLHSGFLTILKTEMKYRFFSEPKAAVLATGQEICQMKTNGMYLRLRRLITL